MLSNLETFLIKLTKPSIENNEFNEEKQKEKLKRDEIDQLQSLIFTLLESKQLHKEIFKVSFRPALGHLLSLLLDTFEYSKTDNETRQKCGAVICEITNTKYIELSANFIAFTLPGIFVKIKNILLLQKVHSIEIVQFSSKILSNILNIAFSPCLNQNLIINDQISVPSIITFERDEKWIKMAKEKIFPQFCQILTNLTNSKIDGIRFEAILIISNIFDFKGDFCEGGDEFNKISIDICSLLFNDEQTRISQECKHLFAKIQSENATFVETYLINLLVNLLKTLEKDVINSTFGGQFYFQKLINIFEMLGSNSLNNLFYSVDFKEHLLTTILSIIIIEKEKQLISIVKNCESEQEILLPPLKFGIEHKSLAEFTHLLANLNNFEDLFDILINKFISFSSKTTTKNIKQLNSILYLIYYLLINFNLNKLNLFINDLIFILKLFDSLLEKEILDNEIVDYLPLNTDESGLVGLIFNCLSKTNLDKIEAKNRGDLLYETLKYCSSTNINIKEAANNCLNRLVRNCHQYNDVSQMIFANAHLLMFKILIAAQDFPTNPRFPLVLSEMINKCSKHPKLYFNLKGALNELLFWLDFSNHKQTLLLLFALNNYCKALFNWFYPLIPPMEANEEEKPSICYQENEFSGDETAATEINKNNNNIEEEKHQKDVNYPLIQNLVTILNRTKHFISSQHLPVQLAILDILKYSLKLVKNYENEVLPMIHQNWIGLIQKFGKEQEKNANFQNVQLSNAEMLVSIKSIEIINIISEISKDFVYWKIVKEYLPRVCALLENLYKHTQTTKIVIVKENVVKHSVTFKLQIALIESIPSIIENSGAFKQNNNMQRIKKILIVYSNCQDTKLSNSAEESLKKLNRLEEN